MTLLFEHTSEGATDEADVAAAVSGFGTPWTAVVKTGAAVIKYDTAQAMHGTVAIRYTRGATGEAPYCRADLASAALRMQARAYFRFSAAPTSSRLFTFRNASGFMGYIGTNSTGRLQAFDTGNVANTPSLATTALAANTWYRIEAAIKKGTGTTDGTLEWAYYTGDGTTAIQTWSSAAINTGTADPIQCRFGSDGSTLITQWVDDPALGDAATGWLGPTTISAPIAIVNGQVVHLIDASGSTVSGGTLTYSIAQTSGTTTTPSLITAGIWKVVPHASSTLVYDVTVTGSLGGSDVETVTVPPLSAGSTPVQMFSWNGSAWV